MKLTMTQLIPLSKYMEMIDKALFELSDLRESIEYDEEGIVLNLAFIDELEGGLKKLQTELVEGHHTFDGEALPFMTLVSNQRTHILPFKRLLEDINHIHCKALIKEE
jgi:hypothetical protein